MGIEGCGNSGGGAASGAEAGGYSGSDGPEHDSGGSNSCGSSSEGGFGGMGIDNSGSCGGGQSMESDTEEEKNNSSNSNNQEGDSVNVSQDKLFDSYNRAPSSSMGFNGIEDFARSLSATGGPPPGVTSSDIPETDVEEEPEAEMLPCPEKPPNKNDKNWRSYEETGILSNPAVFHCGYKGFLEAREKPPGSLTNECFYDEMNNLVDENHPHAACGGTPDEYPPDSLINGVKHTFIDKGGIVRSGGPAFIESREVELERLEEEVLHEFNEFENRIINRALPHDFRR